MKVGVVKPNNVHAWSEVNNYTLMTRNSETIEETESIDEGDTEVEEEGEEADRRLIDAINEVDERDENAF